MTETDSLRNVSEVNPSDDTKAGSSKGKKKKKKSVRRALAGFLIKLAIVAAVVWILLTKVGGVYICHTNDMYPAVRDGDLLIIFRLSEIRSGDIIAYGYEGQTLFGRVAGEPGDRIYIGEDGEYTINDIRPYETIFYQTLPRENKRISYPYRVDSGEYFVLADAREQGFDSRAAGPVTKENVYGKVVLQLRRRGF